ncbi:TetR family transcriptional regulator [Fulvivirga ulvae]|uniref:TetR family transcriptional regulator C-terminal domain-containing protein n=1 Tax=Fulvivirga ulvae TaxID=2904245 RepID=UPI001F476D3D|nr:TetR family transcriptional regulator [Fulvivirga ulvae]UII33020.1 TetR family transcriptional regulator [Fulvivirga ulvae]
MELKEISTRERIIQQSAELFNTYGYHGCSLSHIMEATKLKKGGIYNHFRNKDEIAVEAFNYNYGRVLKRFRERLDKDKSSFDKLNSVIDVFVSLIEDPMVKGGGCPIFNTAMDSTNTHPELKEKAREGIKGLTKYVKIKLAEGIDAGEFRPDIDINVVATLLIATLEGAIIMSRVNDDYACIELASGYLKNYIREKILISGQEQVLAMNQHMHWTPAQATLWGFLKEKQLAGRDFRINYTIGDNTLDFYCAEERLAVKLMDARQMHTGVDGDDLIHLGIRLLSFTEIEVFKNTEVVLDEIRTCFMHP